NSILYLVQSKKGFETTSDGIGICNFEGMTSPLFHKHRHAVQQDGHHRLSKYTRVREAIAS
ncbi:unnamed protein product, partial [Pylaiella littoralis]